MSMLACKDTTYLDIPWIIHPVFNQILISDTNVPILMALGLEKVILKVRSLYRLNCGCCYSLRIVVLQNFIRARVCMILHIINIVHVLILPIVVIYVKYEQIGPGKDCIGILRLLKQSLQPDHSREES